MPMEPCNASLPAQPPEPNAPRDPTVVPHTVLLVEDSRLAAEAVRLICRRLGLRLRRADSLSAAMLHLRVYRPDMALIDPGLPDGCGLSVLRQMRAANGHGARLVAISGDPDMARACLDAGADAFIAKPFNPARHLATLLGPARLADLSRRLGGTAPPRLTSPPAPADRGPAAPGMDPAVCPRNGGGDPMALFDDLRHAERLMRQAASADDKMFAARFASGVARCAGDAALAAAAHRLARGGDAAALLAALATRIAQRPTI